MMRQMSKGGGHAGMPGHARACRARGGGGKKQAKGKGGKAKAKKARQRQPGQARPAGGAAASDAGDRAAAPAPRPAPPGRLRAARRRSRTCSPPDLSPLTRDRVAVWARRQAPLWQTERLNLSAGRPSRRAVPRPPGHRCATSPHAARLVPTESISAGVTTPVAVKIKLKRLGKIRPPHYRIVVADARTTRDGRAIEEIGMYHPKEDPSFIEVDVRARAVLAVRRRAADRGRRRDPQGHR